MNVFLRLLCPTLYAESVPAIDLDELKARGVTTLLLDLDNTLVAWRGWEIPDSVSAWVKDAVAQGMKICIVSNSRTPKRVRELASQLGIEFVKRGAKPRRVGFRDALALLDAVPSEAAVIGDQVFTDVLGGNRLGAVTVLVCPLGRREFIGTKMSRIVERVILRMLDCRGELLRCSSEVPAKGEQSAETGSQKESGSEH